jgi:aspartate kinase
MTIKVCKFGGTSLATREQIEKSIEIMLSDDSRRIMVVSAPGARFKKDTKVTDLLISGADGNDNSFDEVKRRIYEIIPESKEIAEDIASNLDKRLSGVIPGNRLDVLKAFGEYASARILDTILRNKGVDSVFVDPAELGLIINSNGEDSMPNPKSYPQLGKALTPIMGKHRILCVAGFYGKTLDGFLATLPRNGTDVSAAVLARAVRETGFGGELINENFSDVDGLFRANPAIVPYAQVISEMTYREARELSYMGFKLQDTCFAPIVGQRIILNPRNTDNPKHPGTRIIDERVPDTDEIILGVACDKNAVSINMTKLYSDKEVGLGEKLFRVLRENKISYEHAPTGVDSFSLVIREKYLTGNPELEYLVGKLKKRTNAATINVSYLDILAVTGVGMEKNLYTNSRILKALADAGIKDRMNDHGADDLSYNLGVDKGKGEDAVRAIYDEFFPDHKLK